MTTEQMQFVIDLTDKTQSHEEWLAVVRFGLGTLIQNQALLAEIVCREAGREDSSAPITSRLTIQIAAILRELGLRIVPTQGGEE